MKIFFGFIGLCWFATSGLIAGERATPQELYHKVKEAFYFLGEVGESGIPVFNNPKGQFSWKNAYVFVVDCEQLIILAHPRSARMRGASVKEAKGKKGKYVFKEICETGDRIFGEWTEYWWTIKGRKKPSRRIMYMKTVPRLNIQVAASIYNHSMSLEKLRKLSDNK